MEQLKDLQEIQMEIKKELGGASLNHLLQYTLSETKEKSLFDCYIGIGIMKWETPNNAIHLLLEKSSKKIKIFYGSFILLNDQNQALNIFAQSEKFQRELYDAIQIIKNINN